MFPGNLKKFAGLGGTGTVSFSGATISHATVSPTNAIAKLTFKANGTYSKTEGTTETSLGNWIDPQQGMLAHQIRFTNVSGNSPDTSTANADAWHGFADGDFFVEYSTAGGENGIGGLDIEIRLGTGAAKDSAAFTMSAIES